jgi:hypothetical protein
MGNAMQRTFCHMDSMTDEVADDILDAMAEVRVDAYRLVLSILDEEGWVGNTRKEIELLITELGFEVNQTWSPK